MDVTLSWVTIFAVLLEASAGRPLPPFRLKCEGNPVGLAQQDLRNLDRLGLFATDRASPLFSWTVAHTERGARQKAFQLVVASDDRMAQPVWDSGVMVTESTSLRYAGPPLRSGNLYFWTVQWWDHKMRAARSREVGHFMTGILDPKDWSAAQWIAAPSTVSTLPRIFKSITVPAKPIAQAVLFASGLGYSRIYVNGADLHRLANPPVALNPGWTNYEIRVPYSVYDVTDYFTAPATTIEVLLGVGWRDAAAYPNKDGSYPSDTSARVLRGILNVTFADGTYQSVATDSSWSASATPYTSDSVYNGESYDARQSGPSSAAQAVSVSGPYGQMYLPSIPYMAETGTDSPVAIYRLPSDASKQIVDFGNNSAGVCRLSVAGFPSGTVLQIRHAEVPQHPPYGPQDGSLYYDNLRSAKQTDTYTCNGSDPAYYQPTFTYHGFRYAEVSGYPRDLSAADIAKVNVHSNVLPNGQLRTSDPILLAIQAMAVRGQLSNLMSVPTDCDQRDERLGWMGDAGLSSDSMLLNFHMDSFLPHYAQLMADEQLKGPTLPDVVPFYRYGTRPADPSWGAAFPQLVWALYHYYGDLATAKALYPSVLSYIQFILSTIPSSGIGNLYGYYGDWVPPPPQPKVGVSFTSAFSFLLNVKQTLELAQALGQQSDVATLTSIFEAQSASFNKAFFNGQSYTTGLQISYVLPLYLGIVPADSHDAVVADFLNQLVGSDRAHVTAGIIGTKFLLPVLSLLNRSDLALEVVRQTDYPSWGFMLYNTLEPATTIWELWNAHNGSAGMDSRNHHMFSSVSGWMMTEMVGLTLPCCSGADDGGGRGLRELEFHPARYLDLSDAAISYQHPKPVHFSWRRDGGVQCAKAPEASNGLKVSCGQTGGVIDEVLFASFGNPVGGCGRYREGSCHASNSREVVEKLCIGKNTCVVPTDEMVWGGVCRGETRWMVVSVQCKSGEEEPGSNFKFSTISVNVSVPVGSTAVVYLPAHGKGNLDVWEGQHSHVWSEQTFLGRGVEGLLGGVWVSELDAVKLSVLPGQYSFTVKGQAPMERRCVDSEAHSARQTALSPLVVMRCRHGNVISSVDWVSYGNPTTTTAARGERRSHAFGSCDAGSGRSVVERKCLGQPSCQVHESAFGSAPCPSLTGRKRLVVEYTCNRRPVGAL